MRFIIEIIINERMFILLHTHDNDQIVGVYIFEGWPDVGCGISVNSRLVLWVH